MKRIVFVISAAVIAHMSLAAPAAEAANGDCGQPQSTGAAPVTGDALATLRAAVGSASSCDANPCVCDVDADGAVETSDALRILRVAVGQAVTLTCDCGAEECVTLAEPPSLASAAAHALDVRSPQVMIEVKLVGVNTDSFDDLGLSFDLEADVTTDAGPAAGGTNGDGRTLAVGSDVTGGPPGLEYLLYGTHRADGALPVLNPNFSSPFDGVKTFFLLPTQGCVLFDEADVTLPQFFPGQTPVENVPPADDDDLAGGVVLHDVLAQMEAASLLASIQGDTRNDVLEAPTVYAYPGQTILHMADDVEPSISQIADDFRMNVQEVTPAPFGNFTGVTLDIVPTISNGSVALEVRPGTQALSFFFSTAFQVNGTPVDAEIPLHRRGRQVVNVTVPSGSTVVLGGLLRDGQQTADKGLPLIGRLPLLGSLFTHKRLDPEMQNLVVFITPTIVDSE